MKNNPAEAQVRQRMQPGVLVRDGFLGQDQRSIDEIVAADQVQLDDAQLTRADLADLLDELHQHADAALGSPCRLYDGKITVELIEVAGRIACPFDCGQQAHKAVVAVQTPQHRLLLTPLQSHLIRDHGFFQGNGSPFRLEPADAIALYRLCRG